MLHALVTILMVANIQHDTAYWVLFNGVKYSLFSQSPFNSKHFITANMYFTYDDMLMTFILRGWAEHSLICMRPNIVTYLSEVGRRRREICRCMARGGMGYI